MQTWSMRVRTVDMTYELKVIPDTQIALFCWSGLVTLEERMENIKIMAQFCKEKGISQLIVDTRQQISDTLTMDMYDFGAAIAKVMRGIRIAVVCRPSDKDTQFGETVAANRGADSHVVFATEEAMSWLAAVEVKLDKPDASDG
jgi:hypothetical protein